MNILVTSKNPPLMVTSFLLRKLGNQKVDNFQENKTLIQAARRLLKLVVDSSVLRHQSRFVPFLEKRISEPLESDFFRRIWVTSETGEYKDSLSVLF